MTTVSAVILAGGQSSRLYPFNKVLSDLTGKGRTLLQQAYDRVKPLTKNRLYVLTSSAMAPAVRKQLSLSSKYVLSDPARRGTWPAILWAMAHLRKENPDTIISVLTGDHVIQNLNAFREAMRRAIEMASRKSVMVMMGIPPTQDPLVWRGYGCFRVERSGRVTDFQEKPSQEGAERMIREGGWVWNSGMFFFRLATAEACLKQYQPEMFRTYERLCRALALDKQADAERAFSDFPEKIPHAMYPARSVDNSIDYAIMTPLVTRPAGGLEAGAVYPVRFDWTDLGRWDALGDVVKKDRKGNSCVGNVKRKPDVEGCILVADKGHRIECSGIQNLIVAFSSNAALVSSPKALGGIKEAAQEAMRQGDKVLTMDAPGITVQLTGKRLVVSAKRVL